MECIKYWFGMNLQPGAFGGMTLEPQDLGPCSQLEIRVDRIIYLWGSSPYHEFTVWPHKCLNHLKQWITSIMGHGLTLIPTRISNHMSNKVLGEITYPFPNSSGATVEIWEWISNFITHYMMYVITYQCRFKLNHVSKRRHRSRSSQSVGSNRYCTIVVTFWLFQTF